MLSLSMCLSVMPVKRIVRHFNLLGKEMRPILLVLVAVLTCAFADDASGQSLPDWPSGARRGIQSMYFGKFTNTADIFSALGDAPSGRVIEIAFSPVSRFTNSSNPWGNALAFINKFPSRPVILTVHFGHHSMEEKTSTQWADSFYNGVFRAKFDDAYFVLSAANEQNNGMFESNMKPLLDQLVRRWKADPGRKSLPFPYNRIRVRRFDSSGTGVFNGFISESEFHLPDTGSSVFPQSYTVCSNDGQTVEVAAVNGTNLKSISLSSIISSASTLNMLLWNPWLHWWRFDSNDKKWHADGTRKEPSGSKRTEMINQLRSFMKG